MENLRKLAEEQAKRIIPIAIMDYKLKDDGLLYNTYVMPKARESYIKGFLDHAQLAAEDKKELLEALKEFKNTTLIRDKGLYIATFRKVCDVIKKHETI